MSEIVLSILIPSLAERSEKLNSLLLQLESQISLGYVGMVEILVELDSRQIPTGTKRNILVQRAKGKYIIFVDDDDAVPDYYVKELLKAAESDADCFGMTGIMTTDGKDEKKWYICLGCPYTAQRDEKGKEEYIRFPNHISGIKREIASRFPFPPISQTEDYAFASAMRNADALKTEFKIERHPMYHYDYKTVK